MLLIFRTVMGFLFLGALLLGGRVRGLCQNTEISETPCGGCPMLRSTNATPDQKLLTTLSREGNPQTPAPEP